MPSDRQIELIRSGLSCGPEESVDRKIRLPHASLAPKLEATRATFEAANLVRATTVDTGVGFKGFSSALCCCA